jgi:uncharacterized repeat protein (TIGR01451 family)
VRGRYQPGTARRWIVAASSIALVFAIQAPVLAAAIEPLAGCTTNTLPANDDGSTGAVDLGFTANFFGTSYTQLYINNNGNVTFTGPLGAFTPQPLVSAGVPIIAPFWADVDTTGAGSAVVSYGPTTFDGHPALCVDWEGVGVGYFAGHYDKLNKFQLLIVGRTDVGAGDFDILFNYDQVQWETGDASGGVGGLGGSSARAGYSNGDSQTPATSFELAGSAVNGAFLDSNVTTGLVNNSHNSAVLGRYIFPVRNGTPVTGVADLSASMTDSPDPVSPGAPVRYEIDVDNAGPDAATNTTLTGQLPSGTQLLGSDAGCSAGVEGDLQCSLGTIAVGGTVALTIDLQAPQAPGDFTFTVFASAAEDTSGAEAQQTTTVTNPSTSPDDGGGFATGNGSTTVQTTPDGVQFSTITVPAGFIGPVTMHEFDEACALPTGTNCIGQTLDLTAPSATAATPLVLKILVAKSTVTGRLTMKNGVLYHTPEGGEQSQVPSCSKGSKKTASPAPTCLSSIKGVMVAGVGYWQYLVYTEENGRWRPGKLIG